MSYWEECIKEAFEDSKIEATSEQIDNVTAWVENSYENYGMAHGHDCAPNPLESELREQKRRTKEAEVRVDKEREHFRNNVARRHGVRPEHVTIGDDGEATYCV